MERFAGEILQLRSNEDQHSLFERFEEFRTKKFIEAQRKIRESKERYFPSSQLNALQLALTSYRYRFKNSLGDSNEERLHALSLMAKSRKSYFNGPDWEVFSEALLLFEIYADFSQKDWHENLSDEKLESAGVSRNAIRLIKFMRRGSKERDSQYFARIRGNRIATMLMLATLAYDLREIRLQESLGRSTEAALKREFALNHLDLNRDLWYFFSFLHSHASVIESKDDKPRQQKNFGISMRSDHLSGTANSEMGTLFAKLQLLPVENQPFIRHDKTVCKRCSKLKTEFNGDYSGHKVLVAGRVAQAIALQTSFDWDDWTIRDDKFALAREFWKYQSPKYGLIWYSLEFQTRGA